MSTDDLGMTRFEERMPPWVQVGRDISTATTVAVAAKLAEIDFDVSLVDAGYRGADRRWRTAPQRYAVVRTDNGEFYEFVSAEYTLHPYPETFGFLDQLVPRFLAGGPLSGGRQAFLALTVPEHDDLTLPFSDQFQMHLVVRASNDKSRGLECAVMAYRLRSRTVVPLHSDYQRWSLRAPTDEAAAFATVGEILRHLDAYRTLYMQGAVLLNTVKLTPDSASEILAAVLPDKPRRLRQIVSIIETWQTSDTNGYPASGWGLVNAMIEYLMWGRSDGLRTDRSRITDLITGPTYRYTYKLCNMLGAKAR